MEIYHSQGKSLPQRLTLLAAQTVILAIAGWMLFGGAHGLYSRLGWKLGEGNEQRELALFVLYDVVYLRMTFMIFYLLKRSISWQETFSVPFAFALYYIGFTLFSQTSDVPLGAWDILIFLLFSAGSWLNTYSEWRRNLWKKQAVNKGKLYTQGLFRYSMHINYFGDVLWVTALALLTRNPWALLVPALLMSLFIFYNIPMLDRHLEQKYGDAFTAYKKSASKLIPFIY